MRGFVLVPVGRMEPLEYEIEYSEPSLLGSTIQLKHSASPEKLYGCYFSPSTYFQRGQSVQIIDQTSPVNTEASRWISVCIFAIIHLSTNLILTQRSITTLCFTSTMVLSPIDTVCHINQLFVLFSW